MDPAGQCSASGSRRGDRAQFSCVAGSRKGEAMNAQSSVQSGSAPFVPRARLLRLIGSELISDDVVAVTELVKNAHDADATVVSIQFVNVSGGEGEIIVRDDGHG